MGVLAIIITVVVLEFKVPVRHDLAALIRGRALAIDGPDPRIRVRPAGVTTYRSVSCTSIADRVDRHCPQWIQLQIARTPLRLA